jgi:hypothetical protein
MECNERFISTYRIDAWSANEREQLYFVLVGVAELKKVFDGWYIIFSPRASRATRSEGIRNRVNDHLMHISSGSALSTIAGYTCTNDVNLCWCILVSLSLLRFDPVFLAVSSLTIDPFVMNAENVWELFLCSHVTGAWLCAVQRSWSKPRSRLWRDSIF